MIHPSGEYGKETTHMDNDETMLECEEVSFIDENGDEVRFLHILTFNYEGGKYGALLPIEQIEEDEPANLLMAK